MEVGDLVKRHCRNCVYCRAIPASKSSLCTVYNRSTTLEDSCEHFANVAAKGRFSEIERLPNKETKGIHPEPSEDSLELRIKELEEELATATHCWGVVSERLDWLEDRMAPENAGKSFVIELCDDYRDRFFEIKEEDILDDEDEQLYDRLIKEIIAECHSETLDWDEDRMRARLRRVLETT